MKIVLHKCIATILLTTHIVFAQADPCKDEAKKAETTYGVCLKFDTQSTGYMDCVKLYVEQKAKAEVCKATSATPALTVFPPAPALVAAPAPELAPVATPPAPAPAAIAPIAPITAPAAAPMAASAPALSMAGSALPPGCMNEFSGVATGNFDMLGFVKKLPVEVVKVKAQAKIPKTPFNKGPDPDDKKTDIGITVGCLKAFPESKNEMMPLVKDISIEMSIGVVASKAGIARSQVPNDINQLRDLALQSGAKSVADALGFLGAGSGAKPGANAVAANGKGEAADDDEEPEERGGDKTGVKLGIRAGININNFSFGYRDLDKGIDNGTNLGPGLNAGLSLVIPVIGIFGFDTGLDFYYRKLFGAYYDPYDPSSYFDRIEVIELAVSVPVLLRLGNSLFFATGAQLDFPIVSLGTYGDVGKSFKKNRSFMDFGWALMLGYRLSELGFDLKCVYGLTGIFDDFTHDGTKFKDKSSLMQYGFGMSYFF
jgi:hypothetical protein